MPRAPARRPISNQRWRKRKNPICPVRRTPQQAIGSLIPTGLSFGADPISANLTYRAINPQMVVPTLIDGDIKLFQSLAILEYLEEKFPEPPLYCRQIRRRGPGCAGSP